MARIRYIKPDFFSDTTLAELNPQTRLFYIGLFCQLDRNGVGLDDPKLLKREVYPYDDSITIVGIKKMLDELVRIGRLIRFEQDGKAYLFCPTLPTHQKFHRDEKPKYPFILEELLARYQHPASTLPKTINTSANSTGNGELVTGNGQRATVNAAPGEHALSVPVKECIEEWQATLKHFQIDRPVSADDQTQITRAIQRWGPGWIKLAFQGARKEQSGKNYNPANFVSLNRYLHPDKIERMVNLGAGKPGADTGIDWEKVWGAK